MMFVIGATCLLAVTLKIIGKIDADHPLDMIFMRSSKVE